jgi:hypothetical protein
VEKEEIEQMEQTILSAMIDGKTFEYDLTTPDKKRCFEVLKAEGILNEVPQPTDPHNKVTSLREARSVARATAQKSVFVHVASDWQDKWKRWRKENENTGGYPVQGEHGTDPQ